MLLIGWAGALRRSEIGALDVNDVTFAPEGAIVNLRRSKTDQIGRSKQLGLICDVGLHSVLPKLN